MQNRKYHWKIVRTGKLLKWSIDGKPFLTYHDPDPLSGKAHAYFAFSNWVSRGCFDNLKIRRYSAAKAAAPVPSRPKVVSSPSPQPVKAAVKQEVSPSPPRVEVDQDDPPPVRKARKPSLAKKRSPRTNSHAILRLRRPNTHVLPTLRAPTLQLQGKLQNRVYTIRPRPRRR